MSEGAAHNLAAQLPHELGEHLRRAAPSRSGTGEQFTLDEFFDRATQREGAGEVGCRFPCACGARSRQRGDDRGADEQGA